MRTPVPYTDEDARWRRYYDAAQGRPPRDTLLFALDRWEAEHFQRDAGFAVDLGCGEGRDTVELLRRGWRVLAIDSERRGLDLLRARPDQPNAALLETRCERMEDAIWPEADIVSSSFALPFCPPGRFPALWQRIHDSLRFGGRFAGQLFGPNDGWADRGLAIVTRAALDALLADYDVEMLEEIDRDGETAPGKPKHWHIFHIVARRRG